MNILIEGTGAMACLFAARFVQANFPVTMSGTWREGLNALTEQGVKLVEGDGNEYTYPVRVVNRERKNTRYAQIYILAKSWQTKHIADHLQNYISRSGLVLTLQNGLGNQEILKSTLGAKRVCLGVTTAGATLLGPGHVRASGSGKISLGMHPGIESLADTLHQAGFEVEIVADPEALLWGKLIINAAINPLTALMRIPNGELLKRPSAYALMCDIVREAVKVAEAKSINLPYPDPIAKVEEVALRTAANHSSMLQDILRGAPTEVEAINGAIVRAGKEMNVSTPINKALWMLIKGIDNK